MSATIWNGEMFADAVDFARTGDADLVANVGRDIAAEILDGSAQSPNIAAAALEVIRQTYRERFCAPTAPDRPAFDLESKLGIFTVEFADSAYQTIRVKRCGEGSRLAGKTIAEFMSGPDNERSYTGFAFVNDDGTVNVWRRFGGIEHMPKVNALATVLAGDTETTLQAREAYATRSGNCSRCGRTLTVPASLKRGLGPDCAALLGVA